MRLLSIESHSHIKTIGILKIALKTITSVHVGSGDFSTYKNLPLSLNAKNSDGELIIPGSTLKGVTSHYHLAVYGKQEKTSGLFGFSGYMSRALFKDAIPEAPFEPVYEKVGPSWRPRIRKLGFIKVYRTDIPRSNSTPVLALECIPSNTILTTEIIVVNTSEEELAEILLALGYSIDGIILLGYGKPKGLGKIKIIQAVAKIATGTNIIRGEMKCIDLKRELEELKAKYKLRLKEVFNVEL